VASNSQIVANLHRRKRPAKRFWLGIIIAALLVTLPVLPLRFLGIPGPDLDWHQIESIGKAMFGKLTSPEAREKAGENQPAQRIGRADIKLVDASLTTLLKEISEKPQDPSLHNRAGLIYTEFNEPLVAVTHFEQAIKLCREQVRALKTTEDIARTRGDIAEASDCMLQISELNVQLAAAHGGLARVYEKLGKSDKVIAQLTELSKDISPSKVIESTTNRNADSNRLNAAANVRSSDTRLDAGTAAILARADALRQAGRIYEAQQEYKKLTERLPNLAIAHKELGMTALSTHNLWLAQEELSRAASLNSHDATTHSALAAIAKELGQNDKAQQEYERALQIDPKDLNAAFTLGNLYADDAAYSKAIAAFQKAVAARPDFGPAHNNLATMYSLNEQYREAIKEFHQTILLSPNLASAYYGLGIACLHEKQYRESVRAFRRALALNPELSDAHNKLEYAQKKVLMQGMKTSELPPPESHTPGLKAPAVRTAPGID